MTAVEFEQLLSTRQPYTNRSGHTQDAPCIRDMIFDYFCGKYPNDPHRPNIATKEYTDHLYAKLVR